MQEVAKTYHRGTTGELAYGHEENPADIVSATLYIRTDPDSPMLLYSATVVKAAPVGGTIGSNYGTFALPPTLLHGFPGGNYVYEVQFTMTGNAIIVPRHGTFILTPDLAQPEDVQFAVPGNVYGGLLATTPPLSPTNPPATRAQLATEQVRVTKLETGLANEVATRARGVGALQEDVTRTKRIASAVSGTGQTTLTKKVGGFVITSASGDGEKITVNVDSTARILSGTYVELKNVGLLSGRYTTQAITLINGTSFTIPASVVQSAILGGSGGTIGATVASASVLSESGLVTFVGMRGGSGTTHSAQTTSINGNLVFWEDIPPADFGAAVGARVSAGNVDMELASAEGRVYDSGGRLVTPRLHEVMVNLNRWRHVVKPSDSYTSAQRAAAIQSAINGAAAAGGGEAILSDGGEWSIGTGLQVAERVSLLLPEGAVLRPSTNVNVVTLTKGAAIVGGKIDVTQVSGFTRAAIYMDGSARNTISIDKTHIEGVTLLSSVDGDQYGQGYGIHFKAHAADTDHVVGVVTHNVQIYRFLDGIRLEAIEPSGVLGGAWVNGNLFSDIAIGGCRYMVRMVRSGANLNRANVTANMFSNMVLQPNAASAAKTDRILLCTGKDNHFANVQPFDVQNLTGATAMEFTSESQRNHWLGGVTASYVTDAGLKNVILTDNWLKLVGLLGSVELVEDGTNHFIKTQAGSTRSIIFQVRTDADVASNVLTLSGGIAQPAATVSRLRIGTGSTINKNTKSFMTIDPPSIPASSTVDFDVTVTGAEPGDIIIFQPHHNITPGLSYSHANIISSNTVRIRMANSTAGGLNCPALPWYYDLWDFTNE
jgi:hypothetical protein